MRFLRLLAVLLAVALLAAACGGDDNSDDASGGSDDPTEQDGGSDGDTAGDGSGGDDSNAGDDDSSGDQSGAPDIDPGDMPAPGEAVFEVDGQTFTINADDMDYFICEIGDFVNVRSESGNLSVTVQYDAELGRGNVTFIVEDSNVRYDSFYGPGEAGGVSVEDPYVVYEGGFDATDLDDLSDLSDVGTGRVSVTCP